MKKLIIVLLLIVCSYSVATMSSQSAKTSLFTGDAVTTAFTFTFPVDTGSSGSHADLEVYLIVTATGVATQQTETTHYAVSATNNNFTAGGTVTMVTAPTALQQLLIARDSGITQNSDVGSSGVRLTIENALDKLTRIGIEQQDQIDRSIHIPITDDPNLSMELGSAIERANTTLGFDADGNPELSTTLETSVVITAAGKGLIDDDTYADMRTTLGVSASSETSISGIWTNVQDYDAVGDGATDDTVAIQAVIDAASSGTIITGNGATYAVKALYLKSDIMFRDFDFFSIAMATEEGYDGLSPVNIGHNETDSNDYNDIYVTNVHIDGNRTNQTGISSAMKRSGFRLAGKMHDIYIENSSATYCAGDGIWMGRGATFTTVEDANVALKRNINITNCIFNWNKRQGGSGDSIEDSTITNCHFNYNGRAINGETLANVLIGDTAWTDFLGCGVWIESYQAFDFWGNLNFVNCQFIDNERSGLLIHGGDFDPDTEASFVVRGPLNVVNCSGTHGTGEHYSTEWSYLDAFTISPYRDHRGIDWSPFCNDVSFINCNTIDPSQGRLQAWNVNRLSIIGGSFSTIVGSTTDMILNACTNVSLRHPQVSDPPDTTISVTDCTFLDNRTEEQDDLRSFTKGTIRDMLLYEIPTTASYVNALWFFDTTSGGTVTDWGQNSHDLTLSATISSWTHFYEGFSPYIRPSGALTFDIADHDDFSFNGTADTAFSIVALLKYNPSNGTILAKRDGTTGSEQKEWLFYTNGSDELTLELSDNDSGDGGKVTSATDANMTADEDEVHCYAVSYDGSAAGTGIAFYRDGTAMAATAADAGTYTAMRNTTSKVGNYYINTVPANVTGRHSYLTVMVIREELSAANMKRISDLLLSYANAN